MTPDADPELALGLRSVCLRYDRGGSALPWRRRDFWALRDLTFDVLRGETLGIVGRNGAGKSTLLRVLAGIISPDRGEVIDPGFSRALLSLQVGFTPHLSARRNIMLSGLLLGLEPREIRERMEAIIAFSELEEFIDEPIQTYSTGMRARLGFAIAFHADPDILLIDEVLGVGDAAFVSKSKKVMREKVRSAKTVVLVSHSAAAIQSLCDRAVWIDRGLVRALGETSTVLREYSGSSPRAGKAAGVAR